MKFNLGILVVFLLSKTEARVLGNAGVGLQHGNGNSQAKATACISDVSGTVKCKFSASDLKLQAGSTIVISVNEGGREIKCNHKSTSKGHENGWYGDCNGDAQDANFVTRTDLDGIDHVYGSIRVGSNICQIHPNANKESEIKCTPMSNFVDEVKSLETLAGEHTDVDGARNLNFGYKPSFNKNETYSVRGSAGRIDLGYGGSNRRLYDNSGANIDVLVVWTNLSECLHSGLKQGCNLTSATETNMRGLIDLAIFETNTAFNLSGVNTSLRLVYAYRDSVYVEPTDWTISLGDLRNATDGKLDSVHAKRTLYGADAVHMIIGRTNACGIAYAASALKAYMFSISSYSCATGYYSFGHEISHNLNALHDSGSTNTCGSTAYNYGYRDPHSGFRSIMAYDCAIKQCDNMTVSGCPHVQRFSNPTTLYNGLPIGDSTHDNVRQLNEKRALAASLYPAMNCRSDTDCNDGNILTVDTCNTVTAVCVFT